MTKHNVNKLFSNNQKFSLPSKYIGNLEPCTVIRTVLSNIVRRKQNIKKEYTRMERKLNLTARVNQCGTPLEEIEEIQLS
jgi:hypothetical protein